MNINAFGPPGRKFGGKEDTLKQLVLCEVSDIVGGRGGGGEKEREGEGGKEREGKGEREREKGREKSRLTQFIRISKNCVIFSVI